MDRTVFIKQDPPAESKSGLIIVSSSVDTSKSNIGTIVSLAEGNELEPMLHNVGDKVMFNLHAARDIDLGTEKLKMIVDTDIFLTL